MRQTVKVVLLVACIPKLKLLNTIVIRFFLYFVSNQYNEEAFLMIFKRYLPLFVCIAEADVHKVVIL